MNPPSYHRFLILFTVSLLASFNFVYQWRFLSSYQENAFVVDAGNATDAAAGFLQQRRPPPHHDRAPDDIKVPHLNIDGIAMQASSKPYNNIHDVLGAADNFNQYESHHSEQTNASTTLLPRCPLPRHSPHWDYYHDLVRENSDMAARVGRLTQDPRRNGTEKEEDESSIFAEKTTGTIPHRLIFTHKKNLFDCSQSASNSSSPELYNLAENAKATVNAYRRIWSDLEFVFLTNKDCIQALELTEPALVKWFNNPMLEGMYKADICRAAYLFLHGGYYFDVDLLVVRPFVAPKHAKFVTVKGDGFPKDGFFQAFLAAEKGNAIIRKSLDVMIKLLKKNGPSSKYLGPMSLMEAWMQEEHVTNASSIKAENNGVYLLAELNLNEPQPRKQYTALLNVIATNYSAMMQRVPASHGDRCQFSGGACNVIVLDESDETLYFYSRVLGTKWCGKKIRHNCTSKGLLLERLGRKGS